MSLMDDLFAAQPEGWSLLQLCGLGVPGLELCARALAAGAARATHAEPWPLPPEAWAVLGEHPGLHHGSVDITDARALAWEWQRHDVVVATQLFSLRDPYPALELLSRFARRHLVVMTNLLPLDEGIAPGDMVPGFLPDPRLADVARALARRGVELPQFHQPAARHDAGGQLSWPGMWEWFQTEAALAAMLEDLGWRVTAREAVWMDLGVVLVAERA